MLMCVFDTETTGVYDYKAPAYAPHQPDIVQVCAWLADKERIYSRFNVFVHSDVPIPDGAYEVHRIDREMTAKVGVSRLRACQMLDAFARKADVMVGHNVDFDINMMLAANIREKGAGEALKKTRYCTMKSSTEICKIPSPHRAGSFKWPSLQEAYKILVDPRGFEDAHDAEADVKACYEIYRVLNK